MSLRAAEVYRTWCRYMASLDAKGGDAECELDFAELQLAMGNLGEALRREREDMLR